MRFALVPIRAELENASRERMMDDAPWTYRIMAEELARERRISLAPTDANSIYDPRDYLYVQAQAEQVGTALSLDVTLNGLRESFSSAMNDARLRVNRSGHFRVAVRLPARTAPSTLAFITTRCYSTDDPADERLARSVKITKVFMLDRNYVPREINVETRPPVVLRPGEASEFRFRL